MDDSTVLFVLNLPNTRLESNSMQGVKVKMTNKLCDMNELGSKEGYEDKEER